jgi:rfaE bifunctional protein nucleotidyltransferase chain/domain
MTRVKIINRDEAARLSASYKASSKRVGYTSGVFDILHPGHVEYLEAARALVDVLIVGLNSDSSVKSNKGDLRPICSEQERAEVLAGLTAVDHIFVFSERNNNLNVELLKPSLYIKAGDYSAEKLSSKDIVEQYGGRVELVPFKAGHSTTSVIERIQMASLCDAGQKMSYERRPAVFLDRDGTINEHIEYLSDPEKFKEIPGAFAAIKRLRDLGFRIIVVTNQPGIGLGYFTKEDFYAVTREMMRQATAAGAAFDKIFFCPHSKADGCACRKPGTYFLEQAARDLNVDLAKSYVIGDMTGDVQLGVNGGCTPILLKTGRGGDDGVFSGTPSLVARDLGDAAEWIATAGARAKL